MWTILAYTGYLTLSKEMVTRDLGYTYEAKIPNKEVLAIFLGSLYTLVKNKLIVPL